MQGQLQLKQGNYVSARENWQHCWQLLESSDFLVNARRWQTQLAIAESWLYEGAWETAVLHLRKAQELAIYIGADAAWQQELDRLRQTYPELMKYVTENL